MRQVDVTADGAVRQRLGADQLHRVEQIHQNFVNLRWPLTNLLLDGRVEVQLAERADLETPRELDVTVPFLQVRDTDKAHDSNLEDAIACILTDEYVDSEGSHTLLNLDIDPNQVLPRQQH